MAPLLLHAQEPFDAAAFVKQLREPTKIEISERALDPVPKAEAVHFMDLSADVKTLCAVHNNGIIATWDVATGKLQSVKRIQASKLKAKMPADTDLRVDAFALSADRSRVALGLRSGDVVFWDVAKEAVVAVMDASLKGKYVGPSLTSNGRYAFLGGDKERGAFVVDTNTGKLAFKHDALKSEATHASISPDDKFVCFAEKSEAGPIIHHFPLLGGQGGTWEPLRPTTVIQNLRATNVGVLLITNVHELIARTPQYRNVSGLRSYLPARLIQSANSQYLAIYDGQGNLEIRETAWASRNWHHQFTSEKARMFAIGSDGRTLAMCLAEGIKLAILSQAPRHPVVRAMLRVQELLETDSYAAIQAVAVQLNQQPIPFAWAPLETPVKSLSGMLLEAQDAESHLQKWMKAEPQAVLPKVLLARMQIAKAWAFRGSGSADTVTAEGWAGFRKHVQEGLQLIQPVAEKPTAHAMSRATLITLAMAASWEQADWMKHADWVIKNSPQHIDVHHNAMYALLPRWGGKEGDSNRYAMRVADAIGGADGDAMYAKLWLHLYYTFGMSDAIIAEFAMDEDRVLRGLQRQAEKGPNNEYFAHTGLKVSFHRKKRAAAKIFLGLLKDPQQNWELPWWQSPKELEAAIRYAEAN